MFFTAIACIVAVVVGEVVRFLGRKLWLCMCGSTRVRKAKKLRDMARAATEAEVDRMMSMESSSVSHEAVEPRRLGGVASTTRQPSSPEPQSEIYFHPN